MSNENSFILVTPVLFKKESVVGRNDNRYIRKMKGGFTKYRENI